MALPATLPPTLRAIAFDIIGTTFSLETLRPRLAAQGLPPATLETWFARLLRDAFALAATGAYASFRDVAGATLAQLARDHGRTVDPDPVLAGFAALDPHPGAREAFAAAKDAGLITLALSNGAAETTSALLDRAGIAPDRVISIAEIRQWKPRAEVYLHAANALGVPPASLALVATHAWDVHGAKSAGLAAGFVARGQAYPAFMIAPDAEAETLDGAVRGLIGRP